MELLLALGAVLFLRSVVRRGASASGAGSGPLDNITEASAQFEGFYQPNSVAQRYNNPDNVKGDWPGVVGHTSSGIAIFDDVGDGWDAAHSWFYQQEQQHPDWTFSQLFAKFLGDLNGNPVNNDQGNSENYANYVANYLGVPPDSRVTDYTGDY